MAEILNGYLGSALVVLSSNHTKNVSKKKMLKCLPASPYIRAQSSLGPTVCQFISRVHSHRPWVYFAYYLLDHVFLFPSVAVAALNHFLYSFPTAQLRLEGYINPTRLLLLKGSPPVICLYTFYEKKTRVALCVFVRVMIDCTFTLFIKTPV